VAGAQLARIVQVSPRELAAWSAASVPAAASPISSVSSTSTPTPTSPSMPAFQRRNFALARVAAEAYLADAGIAVREDAVREAALTADVPGRMQVVADDPLTVLDGAHNPDAARALVESLPALLGGRRLAIVMGVLEDKDAARMLAALQSLARQQGFEQAVCEPHPRRALEQAREWARAQPGAAAVLATGSVYLVGDLLAHWAERDAAGERAAVAEEDPAGGWRA
jgi:dihydrofolate synthase/folylpolyglutamate synthase